MDKDKVLIIDDSAVQGEFLCSVLSGDYEVTTCQTAREGLDKAKEGSFSLILLDIVMPDMDGFMLLQELKATDLTRHIPVILLTSLADIQYEERGLLLGAVDYVAKPFSPVIIRPGSTHTFSCTTTRHISSSRPWWTARLVSPTGAGTRVTA